MTGRFTRKMYDRCASSQDLAQSTGPLELILDANKYVNCGNICRPLEQFSGDSAALVDVESSLWGIDKLASRCDEAKHPFCGPNGCMLTDDPRIPRHTPPFLCERGRMGDNAVVTTNMEMPTDVGYKIADPNICDVRNGYYFDPSKWQNGERRAQYQGQQPAPTGDYAAWVQTNGPISDQLAPVMNIRPQHQIPANATLMGPATARTGQLLANLDQIRATHQYSQDHGRRVANMPQAQAQAQAQGSMPPRGQQLLANLGLAARGGGAQAQAQQGSQVRGIAPRGSMQRPDGSRVSSFGPKPSYDGSRQMPPRDGSRQLPQDWASRLPLRDGGYQLFSRDGGYQLPPRDGTYQLPRDGTYQLPRDGSYQRPEGAPQFNGQRIQQVRDTRATGYPSETQMRPQLPQSMGPIAADGTYAQSIPMIGADGQLRAGLTQYAGNMTRPQGVTPGQYLPPLRNQQTAPVPAAVPTVAPAPTTGSRGHSLAGSSAGHPYHMPNWRNIERDVENTLRGQIPGQGQAQGHAAGTATGSNMPSWRNLESGVENAAKGEVMNKINQQLGRLFK